MQKEPLNESSSIPDNKDHELVISKVKSLPENVWEAIFDSIPDLITVIDKNCRVVRANKAMTERLGITEESMVGSYCYESIHGLFSPMGGCPHVQLLEDGQGHISEVFEPLLNGVFLVSTTPVFDKEGTVVGSVHIARDITLRKQAEDKLQTYTVELEDLNANKDKFFSVIAHDLKSPFQGLLGFTDLLLEDFDMLQKDEIKNYLINIRNASHNTYSLLENLLDWSRIQSGRMNFTPSRINLAHEVGQVLDILNSNAIRKGISLTSLVEHEIEVFADQNMVHSVIQNLVSNAIKFSNSRGQVVVTAEKGQISNNDESPDNAIKNYIKVNVRDHGIGIPQEAIARIFSLTDHFSLNGTANEPGTGLGLILSKEMIERHGGELTVNSKPGEGSTFSFTLPVE
ncbi:MAG: PAS domain-containing sensor histidine kinase [Bacteroidetes bacterium]|nr:PAS domain-containing sensor histidine kinase [Bacteroidota bacterium]